MTDPTPTPPPPPPTQPLDYHVPREPDVYPDDVRLPAGGARAAFAPLWFVVGLAAGTLFSWVVWPYLLGRGFESFCLGLVLVPGVKAAAAGYVSDNQRFLGAAAGLLASIAVGALMFVGSLGSLCAWR